MITGRLRFHDWEDPGPGFSQVPGMKHPSTTFKSEGRNWVFCQGSRLSHDAGLCKTFIALLAGKIASLGYCTGKGKVLSGKLGVLAKEVGNCVIMVNN